MAEVGILGENAKTELIDGQIVLKKPQGDAHILVALAVFAALQTALGGAFTYGMQIALKLEGDSEPEPDVIVLKGGWRDYDGHRPDPAADVVLVVEVSVTSLAFDRTEKVALYARHGVAEYWIVNVPGRSVEVRCEPGAERYAETRVYAEGESVPVGGGAVAVADVLPKVA